MYGNGFDNDNPNRPSVITTPEQDPSTDLGRYVITCKRCDFHDETDSASHAIMIAVDHDQEHKGAIREGDV